MLFVECDWEIPLSVFSRPATNETEAMKCSKSIVLKKIKLNMIKLLSFFFSFTFIKVLILFVGFMRMNPERSGKVPTFKYGPTHWLSHSCHSEGRPHRRARSRGKPKFTNCELLFCCAWLQIRPSYLAVWNFTAFYPLFEYLSIELIYVLRVWT